MDLIFCGYGAGEVTRMGRIEEELCKSKWTTLQI
jgi:hypothetical protein